MKILIPLALLILVGCGSSSDEERLADLRRQMENSPPPLDSTGDDNLDEDPVGEQTRLEDVYNQEIERLGGTRRPSSSASNNRSSGQGRYATSSEWKQLAETLVTQIAVGLSADRVRTLMGEPHEVNEHQIAGKSIVIWTWKKDTDPENAFIHLDVSGGIVNSGGSTGYDIRTGFKTTLPGGGDAEQRARLKATLQRMGVQVEE